MRACVCVCVCVCMYVCYSGENITVLELGCAGVCEHINKVAVLA